MELEFRCLEGNTAGENAMLMADGGVVTKRFKTKDINTAMEYLGTYGWRLFGRMATDNDCWRYLIGRPKQ
jgi:hypothetical protein